MMTENKNQQPAPSNTVIGVSLVVLGIVFLLGQVFDFGLGHYLWPFFILVPGVLLFVFSLVTGGSAGGRLVVVGSMVTMTGTLLLYQNTVNHFQSWAYAWALVVPTSMGLGQMVYGLLRDHQDLVQSGKRLAIIGGVIFLAGAIFFELIIGFSGFGLDRLGLGSYTWPILLVGLGLFFILRTWWSGTSATQTQASTE